MASIIISSLVYLLGCILCYQMLRVENESQQNIYTKGDRALAIFLSLFSWVMIQVLLVRAWFGKISETNYWNRPVNPPKAE